MEQYHGVSDGNINISDVIEVIQTTDPGFAESNRRLEKEKVEMATSGRIMPYVEIVEQPASKALRFRYECEGRSAGSIPGVHSTPENKSFPSIRVVGYKGRAVVVVSCVTKDPPYRPHPHNLVGKEACKRGVCTVEISSENMTVTFANLGIQCVKKKDIEEALRIREEIRVDPYRTGFDHKRQPTGIDLNAVRLCFQVFIEGTQKGKFNVPLAPVVSEPIYDKKAMSDLVICKLSHCSASVAGGTEMILLCEKVAKEDIQVRFFEEKDGRIVWEGFGDFQPTHVHKQTAIAFRTPSYRIQQTEQPVLVYIQLKRPSDGASSEALPFQMLPLGADDPNSLRRKRQKLSNSPNSLVTSQAQTEAERHSALTSQYDLDVLKPDPGNRVPSYGGTGAVSTLNLYPLATMAQPHTSNMQTLGGHVSVPPMEYMPYQAPVVPDQQQYQYVNAAAPSQTGEFLMLSRVTGGDEPSGLQPVTDAASVPGADITSVLDMDSQQYNFDISLNQLDSAELAVFGTALSDNLSSGLSISDSKPESHGQCPSESGNAAGDMSDSFTRLTNSTIQELCTLNDMYKPKRDDEG